MNRPTSAMMRAFIEDSASVIKGWREEGWPVEVKVVDESDFLGIRIEVPLDGLRIPVRDVGNTYDYSGPPLRAVHFPGGDANDVTANPRPSS